jgi:hypothetical protein
LVTGRDFGRGPVATLPQPKQRPSDPRDDADLQGETEERREAAETTGQAGAEHQAEQAGTEQAAREAGAIRGTCSRSPLRRRAYSGIGSRIGRTLDRPRGRRGGGRRRRAVGARAATSEADAPAGIATSAAIIVSTAAKAPSMSDRRKRRRNIKLSFLAAHGRAISAAPDEKIAWARDVAGPFLKRD